MVAPRRGHGEHCVLRLAGRVDPVPLRQVVAELRLVRVAPPGQHGGPGQLAAPVDTLAVLVVGERTKLRVVGEDQCEVGEGVLYFSASVEGESLGPVRVLSFFFLGDR